MDNNIYPYKDCQVILQDFCLSAVSPHFVNRSAPALFYDLPGISLRILIEPSTALPTVHARLHHAA